MGNHKATGEFLPLLNVAYNRFKSGSHIDAVSPPSGSVGSEVTIDGSSFGSSRGSSYVSFESTQAVQYNEWSDTRIRCLIPAGALSGMLKVTTADGTSNGVNFVVSLSNVESRFYFAEGYTGDNFEEWLCLLNREDHSAIAQITYLFSDGSPPFTKDYPLAADSRVTVNVNQAVGAGKEVSVKLESDGHVLAERPMYFNYRYGSFSVQGGHCVIGAYDTSDQWLLAEGYTGEGFNQWLCLQNPGDSEAQVEVTYFTQEAGTLPARSLTIPARTRATIMANLDAGSNYQLSTRIRVTSGPGIVVERPMYFRYGRGWDGGHDVVGFRTI